MLRRTLKRSLHPTRNLIEHSRWLRPFRGILHHPSLWRLGANTVAGGVLVGAYAGLIPGPFQVLTALLLSLLFRVNLPVAVAFTLYSNPLTIVPLYVAAWTLGQWLTGGQRGQLPAMPDWDQLAFMDWLQGWLHWFAGMGWPFVIGLIALATLIGGAGWLLVQFMWRWPVYRRQWQRRSSSPRPPAVSR